MAIEVNGIAGLKNRNKGSRQTLNDSDYVLRDKSKEDGKNTRDITGQDNKYQEELARIKAEARKEAQAEFMSSDFINQLTEKIKADLSEAKGTKATGGK